MMYRYKKANLSNLKGMNPKRGETLENRVERIIRNKEPIVDGSEPIYTNPNVGVLPEFNARTDRWEIAAEAMDVVHRSNRGSKIDPKNFTTSSSEKDNNVDDNNGNDNNKDDKQKSE